MEANITYQARTTMLPRKTARVLLFDEARRLLLIRMHDPHVGDAFGKVVAEPYWITLGGEVEPHETIEGAALREAMEETGFTDVRLGSPVWYTEHILTIRGTPRLLRETFMVAFTREHEFADRQWTADERLSIKAMKWWDANELQASGDIFFPTSLKRYLPAIVRGDFPQSIVNIEP